MEKVYQRIEEMFEKRPKVWRTQLLSFLTVLGLFLYSAQSVEYKGVATKGTEVALGILQGLVRPDLSMLFNFTTEGVPFLMAQTVAIAVLGTVGGALLALPISFLCSENIVPRPIAFLFRAFVLLIRTIPAFVWALVWIRVTGPGAFCGVVTQAVCSIGMISKMFVTAIEDLDIKILESLDASGCTVFQKIRYGILPQLSANFISTSIYRFDINLKDATTLGIVGAGGIGAALVQSIASRRWTTVGSFLLVLILFVLLIEYVSTKIRVKLARG